MTSWQNKICALLLALAMMPGAFEIMENASHLATEGHLAHSAAEEDDHDSPSPEHGCTAIFHFCGCHANLAFFGGSTPPVTALTNIDSVDDLGRGSQLGGYRAAVERPPRA